MPTPPKISRSTLDDVLSVLPAGDGIPPREVHARQGRWAIVTVRHALRELCLEGSASFRGADCNRRYFRTAAAASPSGQ